MVDFARPPARVLCVLCDAPAVVQGLFVPHDQAGVKAPPGKTRAIGYHLCGSCSRRPDSLQRVGDLILADFAGAARA